MSDQCIHCIARGNLSQCMATKCSYHDLWMVLALEIKYQREIIALTKAGGPDGKDRAETA